MLKPPVLSRLDLDTDAEGSVDPLSLQAVYERLADRILPAVTVRMSRIRFVTAMCVAARVCRDFDAELVARDGVLVAIGSAALLADGLQAAFGWARDARERPLELFNGSLGRSMSRLWLGARDAPSSGSQNRDAREK